MCRKPSFFEKIVRVGDRTDSRSVDYSGIFVVTCVERA